MAFHNGQMIYVGGALAGEHVQAIISEEIDRSVFRASINRVLNVSPERAVPPCPYFTACGGCSAQHMSQALYRDWKTAQPRDDLTRAGIVAEAWDTPVFLPPAARRRAGFKVLKTGGRVLGGFHGERSHRIVPIDLCLVLEPAVLGALEQSKPYLARVLPEGGKGELDVQHVDGQLDLVLTLPPAREASGRRRRGPKTGPADPGLYREWAEAVGAARISRRSGGKAGDREAPETMIARSPVVARFGRLAVDLPAGAFLQPSRAGEAALVETVMAMLAGHKTERVADLFAGCGTFAGSLLGSGKVHAVEFDVAAVSALERAQAGEPLTVERRNLFTAPLKTAELKRFDAVVLDPPRAGAAAQVEELGRSGVPAIVYVSCNAQSFARDARILCHSGYRLARIRLIDQFLWSHHIELVGLFIK